jgi:hypothetical protein
MSLKQLLKSLKRKSKKRTFWTRSRTFVYLIEENNGFKTKSKESIKGR